MTLTDQVVKNIITKIIKSQDYRIEIVNLINAEFLQFAIDFFKKIAIAKYDSQEITIDWYRKSFRNEKLSKDDYAINSGLNSKTIKNMFKTETKTVVINASDKHFESLYHTIQSLVDMEQEIDFILTIKFKGVSVDLNVSESLIVINTLAVKRAAIRGGLWSTAGKRTEKYLMLTLCKLYNVNKEHYDSSTFIKNRNKKVDREVDFYLLNNNTNKYRCEVKLTGMGNPESADAIFARQPAVFVADNLSSQNKNQCDQLGIHWVALRDKDGYKRFGSILEKLGIPHEYYQDNLDNDLPIILDSIVCDEQPRPT
jgi:hypothetical protein